ncbi:hypothetical protein GmHk_07G019674 [Glycine max]|nr:hypothetical protein GmHk_07G019674 [Glycine max]
MGKKLESQVRLKDFEIIFLREKLEEANRQNKAIENRLNQSGQLSILDNLHITRLSPSHKRTREKGDIKEFRRLVLGEFFLEKGEGNEKGKGCKFSNVYMESVIDEIFLYSKVESDPQVAFTVVPGFRIGKTVLQCQVYLSQHQTKVKKNQFNKAKIYQRDFPPRNFKWSLTVSSMVFYS